MVTPNPYSVRLHRIGSDPEFLFGTADEWQVSPLGATHIITPNREVGLRSFIGTDGHQFTGELRPPPSHNVWRHIYDIAAAIVATKEHLEKSRKYKRFKLLASPAINNESMGGHIHFSFWCKDPVMVAARKANMLYNMHEGGITGYDRNLPYAQDPQLARDLASRTRNYDVLNPTVMANLLEYLFIPLERWLMPWHARGARNARYGVGADIVRWMPETQPPHDPPPGTSYWHYEYRTPSTWLIHPTLAFAYLGLGKLAFMNLHVMLGWYRNGELADQSVGHYEGTGNAAYSGLFWERFNRLLGSQPRITPDIRKLGLALERCGSSRTKWFDPMHGVDVDAWRKVMDRIEART